MDPVNTLFSAGLYITDCEVEDASEALASYNDWRSKGGYEPKNVVVKLGNSIVQGDGDYVRDHLMEALASILHN